MSAGDKGGKSCTLSGRGRARRYDAFCLGARRVNDRSDEEVCNEPDRDRPFFFILIPLIRFSPWVAREHVNRIGEFNAMLAEISFRFGIIPLEFAELRFNIHYVYTVGKKYLGA